jgi:CheY-like chemotaxis protein
MKTVLLVEDNDNDVFMMQRACEGSRLPHLFKIVSDGDAAVDYLGGTGAYADRSAHPKPDVVFLDINLPTRDGHEVLKWIRAQPELKNLPVIMLTGSDQLNDVNQAYQLGATSYLQKITDPTEFGQAVRIILKYWLEFHVNPSG